MWEFHMVNIPSNVHGLFTPNRNHLGISKCAGTRCRGKISIGYVFAVRSERRICAEVQVNLAYPRETQEMVFDAHDRAFALFKGTCGRGIDARIRSGELPQPVKAFASGRATGWFGWQLIELQRQRLAEAHAAEGEQPAEAEPTRKRAKRARPLCCSAGLPLQTSHPAGVDPSHCPAFGTGRAPRERHHSV
jgi:hypothetical protein